MKNFGIVMSVAIVVCMALGVDGLAKEPAKPNPFKQKLNNVKPLELPAKCAVLVAQAPATEKEMATVQVIDASVTIHPAATPAVVGAIAKAVPEMAGIAAARAVMLQPKLAAAITKAAAAAAPAEAGRIVYSVCRSAPGSYKTVAAAAASAVPAAGSEILGALTLAIPALKPFIQDAAAEAKGDQATVGAVLDQAGKLAQPAMTTDDLDPFGSAATMPVMAPPRIGLPFVSLSGTPTETDPSQSGEVLPGGRDYARP